MQCQTHLDPCIACSDVCALFGGTAEKIVASSPYDKRERIRAHKHDPQVKVIKRTQKLWPQQCYLPSIRESMIARVAGRCKGLEYSKLLWGNTQVRKVEKIPSLNPSGFQYGNRSLGLMTSRLRVTSDIWCMRKECSYVAHKVNNGGEVEGPELAPLSRGHKPSMYFEWDQPESAALVK